jgi:hypothetical protein
MTTYSKATAEVLEVLEDALREYHSDFVDAGVQVYVLAAYGPRDKDGALKGPALKHGGYACLAMTRIVPVKLRVAGLGDIEILIDGDRWPDLSYEEQLSVLDHELTHSDLVEVDGEVMLDDAGRPKLARRLHDWQHGWFNEVAARHGPASVEVQQAKRLVDEQWTTYFANFFAGREPGPPSKPTKHTPKRGHTHHTENRKS